MVVLAYTPPMCNLVRVLQSYVTLKVWIDSIRRRARRSHAGAETIEQFQSMVLRLEATGTTSIGTRSTKPRMAFYHSKDVKSVLLPAIMIYWFVGMGIIEYPIGQPRKIFSLFYSLTACIFHAVCALFAYLDNQELDWEADSRLINASYITYYGSNVVIVGFIIIISIVCSETRNLCITELEEIDGITKGMGVVHSYERFFVTQILYFGGLFFMTILMSVLGTMMPDEIGKQSLNFFKIFCMQYPFFISTVNEIIFCNLNEMMTKSFEDLNSLLKSLRVKNPYDSDDTEDEPVHVEVNWSDERKVEILYSIRKIYTRLTRLAKRWNQMNAVFILAVAIFSLWIFTIRFFAIYIILSLHGIRAVTETVFIEALLEITFFSGKLSMIVHSAVSLTSEARRSSEIILQHLHPIASLRSEACIFSMQLIYNPLCLSVLGLCSLDYSMLQQIFTTVVTYTIMLIQSMGPLNSGLTEH